MRRDLIFHVNPFHVTELTVLVCFLPVVSLLLCYHFSSCAIISQNFLAIYAYLLKVGGILYTISDVYDLHVWMATHCATHPLFERIPDEELVCAQHTTHTHIYTHIYAHTHIYTHTHAHLHTQIQRYWSFLTTNACLFSFHVLFLFLC